MCKQRFSNAIVFMSSSHICAIVQCVLLSIHNKFIIKMFRTENSFQVYLLPLCWIMHQSIATTAPPPTGKGGDYDFSAFSDLL